MSMPVNIVIGGDLFPTPINYQLFKDGDLEKLFGKEVLYIFKKSDYSICNLEGCLTDENTIPKLKDGPNIRAPKDCINAIKGLGVKCLTLANNHATDYGIKGLIDTQCVLKNAGIAFFGAGENAESITTHYFVNINNKTFCFYSVSETVENSPSATEPGVNVYDEYRVCNELKTLSSECDYLIVLYHGGIENIHYCTESIKTRFHRMADNGADIIISQHTHAIGEEEYYNNSYLLYGQGNFCFHFSKKLDEWTETALLLSVDFSDHDFQIHKHIVRRTNDHIVYDPDQDFSEFVERSDRLKSGDNFENELKELADEKIIVYLQAFRGKNFIDRILRKVLPREKFCNYLRSKYTEKHILKILLALQCEEFREVSSRGLLNMLEDIHVSEDVDV